MYKYIYVFLRMNDDYEKNVTREISLILRENKTTKTR